MAHSMSVSRRRELLVVSAAVFAALTWVSPTFVLPSASGSHEQKQIRATSTGAATRRGIVASGLVGAVFLPNEEATALPFLNDEPDEIAKLKVDVGGEDGGTHEIKIKLRKDWAPRGVRRFKELVDIGEFKDSAFFHVNDHTATFGLPAEGSELRPAAIKDDLVRGSNKRGTVSFVQRGEHSRVNELFINKQDNDVLDRRGIAPIGEISEEDLAVVDKLYDGYRNKPDRTAILTSGNEYLDKEFPKLSKIKDVGVDIDA